MPEIERLLRFQRTLLAQTIKEIAGEEELENKLSIVTDR